MLKITKLSLVPVLFSIVLLIVAVFINGNIEKSKFIEICTYGNGSVILDELIKSDILEDVSSAEVRLKVDLYQNKEMIKDIAGDNFDEVWGVLHQSLIDGFYTFLRLVMCITGIYLALYFFTEGKTVWAWAVVFMTVLFNPFIIVHLEKEVWQIVDIISAAVLGYIIIPAKVKTMVLSTAVSILLMFRKRRIIIGFIIASFLIGIFIYEILEEKKQRTEETQGKYENTFKVLDSLSNDRLGK